MAIAEPSHCRKMEIASSRSYYGWFGGGQIGINYVHLARVVGAEDDID
jgi:hypothetical protein